MCGRFANSETIPVTAAKWSAAVTPSAIDWEPNTDIRPTRKIPVLLDGPLRLGIMSWGWTREFASSGKLINARSEDILTKRTFADAVQRRRCLVPATAWFEWQKSGTGKGGGLKHLLRPDGMETWAMAGIWERTVDGAAVLLLTTSAHPTVATIHDRMPVVIGIEQRHVWLSGSVEGALDLALPFAATAKPV